MRDPIQAIRCDHDGLKMAEVKGGHLVLRTKHHGETHVKIVALLDLVRRDGGRQAVNEAPEGVHSNTNNKEKS